MVPRSKEIGAGSSAEMVESLKTSRKLMNGTLGRRAFLVKFLRKLAVQSFTTQFVCRPTGSYMMCLFSRPAFSFVVQRS